MSDRRDPIDAADELLTYLEDHDDVHYAETGAVTRRRRTAKHGAGRSDDGSQIENGGVWCRVFADGSAGYRFSPVIAWDNLKDNAERAIRSAKTLAQDTPSSYDPETLHRASHPGWGPGAETFETVDPVERLREAGSSLESVEHERIRLSYQRDLLDISVLTTTGSAIRMSIDRGQVTGSVTTASGTRLQTQVGTTTGSEVLDELEPAVESLAESAERRNALSAAEQPSGEQAVLFGPNAAGRLLHYCSQFLEMDTAYAGAMPFERGERIAPDGLSIHDGVSAGSWGGTPYDAEARPTHPVTLVDDGVVTSFLHSVETAIEEEASPSGNLVLPLGFEHAPRIHPRHLDVEAGSASIGALSDEATVLVERIGQVSQRNEATSAKRISAAPTPALYAHNTNRLTPDAYDERDQTLRLNVMEGYVLEDGERAGTIEDATIEFDVTDLRSISGLSACRETVTGTAKKHKATFPYAVTAPALLLRTTVN